MKRGKLTLVAVVLSGSLLFSSCPLGQRVKSFIVEYDKDGKWLPVKLNEETKMYMFMMKQKCT